MPFDYLNYDEQEAYDKVIKLINKYMFYADYKKETIEALDELIELLTGANLD